MAHQSGKSEYTNGKALTWIGGGETKVTAQSSATLSYGVKTEVSLSVSSSVTAGTKTALSLNASVDVAVGRSFSIKKLKSFSVGKGSDNYYADHSVIRVGAADAAGKAKLARLEKFTWILIGLQSAMAISFAIIAVEKLAHQKKLEGDAELQKKQKAIADKKAKGEPVDESELSDDYGADYHKAPSSVNEKALHFYRNFPLGYIASILTIVANLAAFAILLHGRLRSASDEADPNCVLSMDKVSALFLGIKPLGVNASAGMTLNENGLELSAAEQDLGFNKPAGSSSILGFNTRPNSRDIEGARMKLGANGSIKTWGKHLMLRSSKAAAYLAENHTFSVLDGQGANMPPRLRLSDKGAYLKASDDTSLAINSQGSIQGMAGGRRGSFMRLKADGAQLGKGGSRLECSADKVRLGWGGTHIKLDAAGVTIGGALTIIAPGAPVLTSAELAEIQAGAERWDAGLKMDGSKLKVSETSEETLEKALDTINKTLVELRATMDKATSASEDDKQ